MTAGWIGSSRPLEGYFLEDFQVYRVFRHATPRTITPGDASLYIALTGARAPLHCSDTLARSMGYRACPIGPAFACMNVRIPQNSSTASAR